MVAVARLDEKTEPDIERNLILRVSGTYHEGHEEEMLLKRKDHSETRINPRRFSCTTGTSPTMW